MRIIFTGLLIGVIVILLSACASSSGLLVTPVPDKLSYLFFYTEG